MFKGRFEKNDKLKTKWYIVRMWFSKYLVKITTTKKTTK